MEKAQFIKLYTNPNNKERLYVVVTTETDDEGTFEIAWKVQIESYGRQIADRLYSHPKTKYKKIHTIEDIIEISKTWTKKGSQPTAVMEWDEVKYKEFRKDLWEKSQ